MQEANGKSKIFNDGRFVMIFTDGVMYPQMIHVFVKYISQHHEETRTPVLHRVNFEVNPLQPFACPFPILLSLRTIKAA
jgi:hypothetical protein